MAVNNIEAIDNPSIVRLIPHGVGDYSGQRGFASGALFKSKKSEKKDKKKSLNLFGRKYDDKKLDFFA